MKTKPMHTLIQFIEEYLGEDFAEINYIDDQRKYNEIIVKFRTKDLPEDTVYTLKLNFRG